MLNIGRNVDSLQRTSEFSTSTVDVAFAKTNHYIMEDFVNYFK